MGVGGVESLLIQLQYTHPMQPESAAANSPYSTTCLTCSLVSCIRRCIHQLATTFGPLAQSNKIRHKSSVTHSAITETLAFSFEGDNDEGKKNMKGKDHLCSPCTMEGDSSSVHSTQPEFAVVQNCTASCADVFGIFLLT